MLTCTLTTPELQRRKATILLSLREQILETRELASGFAYRFDGSDAVLDELAEFIKAERACCEFFRFALAAGKAESPVWLEITGPEGTKDFLTTELQFTEPERT